MFNVWGSGWAMHAQSLSHVWLFATLWIIACQALRPWKFFRLRCWRRGATLGSSWPRDWTQVCCIGRQILYHWTTLEAHVFTYLCAGSEQRKPQCQCHGAHGQFQTTNLKPSSNELGRDGCRPVGCQEEQWSSLLGKRICKEENWARPTLLSTHVKDHLWSLHGAPPGICIFALAFISADKLLFIH